MKPVLKCLGVLCALAAFAQSPVTITTTSPLPAASIGVSYSVQLNASGGVSPYRWSANAGLPPGLSLSQSGLISGTPAQTGSYIVSVSAVDSERQPQSATSRLQITVQASTSTSALTITSVSPLPNGSAGGNYSFNLAATGGVTPYYWTVYAGSLPPGLTLAASGALTGTPTTVGPYTFTAQVTDSASETAHTATQTFSLRITQALTVTTPTPLYGAAGSALDIVMTASGGVLPEIWQVPAGTQLPTGLTLDTISGFLQGTPPAPGTFTFSVQVSDSGGGTATKALVLIVAPAISITTVSPAPAASAGAAYSLTFAATGGNPAYTWKVDSGALPPGLLLDPATGILSGTPSTAGSYSFVIRLIDTSSATLTKAFTLVVNQPGPGAQLSTNNLDFTALSGGDAPAAQSLVLVSLGPQPLQFTIQIDGGSAGAAAPAWLTVQLLKGATPAQIPVAVDQTGLAPQKYTARILVNTSDTRQNIVTVTAHRASHPGAARRRATLSAILGHSGCAHRDPDLVRAKRRRRRTVLLSSGGNGRRFLD